MTLLERRFTRRHSCSLVEERDLASLDEVLQVLDGELGLAFLADTRFDCPGARLVASRVASRCGLRGAGWTRRGRSS